MCRDVNDGIADHYCNNMPKILKIDLIKIIISISCVKLHGGYVISVWF